MKPCKCARRRLTTSETQMLPVCLPQSPPTLQAPSPCQDQANRRIPFLPSGTRRQVLRAGTLVSVSGLSLRGSRACLGQALCPPSFCPAAGQTLWQEAKVLGSHASWLSNPIIERDLALSLGPQVQPQEAHCLAPPKEQASGPSTAFPQPERATHPLHKGAFLAMGL